LNEKLLKNSKTVQHLTSTVQYNSYKSSKLTGTIVIQLSTTKKNEILKNSQYMKVLINLWCSGKEDKCKIATFGKMKLKLIIY